MAETSFTGLASKVLSITKKVAPFVGAAQAWLTDPVADGRGLEGAPAFIWDRLQRGLLKGKIANPLITTANAIQYHGDKYPIMTGAAAYIGGMIGEEIGSAVGEGKITSFGTILKKYGMSAAINAVISAWVYLAHTNPHGGATSSGTEQAGRSPSSYGDTVYRTRTKAQIRNAAGAARSPS